MSRKGIITVALLFLVAFLLLQLATRGYREVEALQSMEKAMAAVRRDFPGAKPMPTTVLETLMKEGRGSVLLIDARAPEEFALSHLPQAINGQSPTEAKGHFENSTLSPEVIVVAYDSIGFRSAELAEAMKEDGVGAVVYLEGGIFQWANEGRPLVDADGKPTTKVHPYNKLWGRLLKPVAASVSE